MSVAACLPREPERLHGARVGPSPSIAPGSRSRLGQAAGVGAALALLVLVACAPDRTQTLLPRLMPLPEHLDFGSVPLLNESRLELRLDNQGRGALTVFSVHVKEEGRPFRVGPPPVEIARGSQAVVELFFRPLTEEAHAATLVVQTDDPQNPTLEIPMTGVGATRAVMEVDPPTLVFERTAEGSASVQTFTIRSLGNADLRIEALEFTEDGSEGFSFVGSVQTPVVIPTVGENGLPGQVRLTVMFTPPPGSAGDATGGVRITNTDPDQPEFVLPLIAPVNRAPIAEIAAVGEVAPGMTVTLDGSGSRDPDGDVPLTYAWTLLRKPPGASATLIDPVAAVASLDLDPLLPGEYEVALEVTDAMGARSLLPARLRLVARPAQDLLVEVFWDHASADLDLHLLNAPGAVLLTPNDCHYANCTPMHAPLDWGQVGVREDDPVLLRDALVGYGPEVTGIEAPGPGTYRVVVDYRNANFSAKPGTRATVRVYSYGVVVFEASRELLEQGVRWNAVDVAWPSGVATAVGTP